VEVASARPSDELKPSATPVRLLSILVVVGVLVGVAGLLIPRIGGGSSEDAERKAVVSRASDFAVTYNTYEVAEKDDYQKRMKELLTPGYYKEFTTVTNALFEALEAKDQKSGDAKVLGVAIETIDDDSAVALVAVDANITTSRDEGAVARRFRWKVTFAHQKGDWVVSQFETVATLEAETGDPNATPSPSPSASEEGDQ
jgi:hypothetical protein